MDAFLTVMTVQQSSIWVQLNDVVKNRKTIILRGRENIPLRGHHDSGLDLERNACESQGNF